MKLVLAIVNNDDAPTLNSKLVKSKFSATKLSTTGGFMRAGNTTMIIGVEDESVQEVIDIIASACQKRKELIPSSVAAPFASGVYTGLPIEVTIGGATVFVLDIERFEKL